MNRGMKQKNNTRTKKRVILVGLALTVPSVAAAREPIHATLRLDAGWGRDALKIVAFVQQRRSRRVVAMAVRSLE